MNNAIALSHKPFANLALDAELQAQVNEAETLAAPKARQFSVPNGLPPKLDAMLRTLKTLIVAGAVDDEDRARSALAGAWVNLNADEPRYLLLRSVAEEAGDVAFLIHRDLRPETVRDAALRLLRKAKALDDVLLLDALKAFLEADILEKKDIAQFI